MKWKVLIKQRHSAGISTQFLEIVGDHCLIGRKDADILLTESRCSRNHALLYVTREGNVQVRDLQSTNGTILNRRSVTEATVRVGDELKIGEATLLLVDIRPDEREAPADSAPKRAQEVSIAWTKEDTITLKEAAQRWPSLADVEMDPPRVTNYVPGKGSRF
jgi:pSer/pThr/pTyr-binding forkhead associated (FHA) protein